MHATDSPSRILVNPYSFKWKLVPRCICVLRYDIEPQRKNNNTCNHRHHVQTACVYFTPKWNQTIRFLSLFLILQFLLKICLAAVTFFSIYWLFSSFASNSLWIKVSFQWQHVHFRVTVFVFLPFSPRIPLLRQIPPQTARDSQERSMCRPRVGQQWPGSLHHHLRRWRKTKGRGGRDVVNTTQRHHPQTPPTEPQRGTPTVDQDIKYGSFAFYILYLSHFPIVF